MTGRENIREQATALLKVTLFAAFVAFAGLWSLPPLDRDEARFAQATAQMLETGDFITIRFQETERNKKPGGIYWLQAASVSIFSDVEKREIWAYRIPSMIGVILAAIFTFFAAQKLYDQRTAFLAALLLASAPVVAAEGTIAKTDGLLLALICLAQWAFLEVYSRSQQGSENALRWPLIFWTAQAAAILTKGPIGPLISTLTGAGLLLRQPRLGWIASMRPILGVALLVLLVAPWAAAIGLATDGRFFAEALGGDMFSKVNTAQESHAGPPGYHALLVWVMFWPAAALIPAGLIRSWSEREDWRALFLLAWVVPAWIVFEVAATKLPHYVLPLYPALAIMAARAATQTDGVGGNAKKIGALIYAAVGLFAAGIIAALPVLLSEAPITALCFIASALIALAALLIARLFWIGQSYTGGICASFLAAIFAWTLMTGVLPGLSQLAVSPRISTALDLLDRHPLRDDAGPAALAGYAEPSAIFLLGTDTVATSGDRAARLLQSGAVKTVIVEKREEENFAAPLKSTGADVSALAVIDGVNYSNGDTVTLTIFALNP